MVGNLETHLINYKEKFITFLANDKLVTLQGEQNQGPLQAHSRQFKHLQSMSSITATYTLQVQAADPLKHTTLLELPHNLASDVASILHSLLEVFQLHRGLPPACAHDHHIPLLPNTTPVKVRPYRYPHSQKSKIAKIVLCYKRVSSDQVRAHFRPKRSSLKRRMVPGVFALTSGH